MNNEEITTYLTNDERRYDLHFEGIVPDWIKQDILMYQIVNIVEGGCESGAYMPAVTYHEARRTMCLHGNAVVEYLSEYNYSVKWNIEHSTFSNLCTELLSEAVEIWAYFAYEDAKNKMGWIEPNF